MEQPSLIVRYALEPGADPEAVQRAIDEQFKALADVRVKTGPEESVRFAGPEVVDFLKDAGFVIAAAVVVVKQSRDLGGELLKLIEETVRGIRGIKKAAIETATKQIPLEQATKEDLQTQLDRSQRKSTLPAFE